MDQLASTRLNRRTVLGGMAAASAALALGRPALAQDKVKLVVLTHWGTKEQKDVLDAIFANYTAANPNVEIDHQTVAFADLVTRITTGQLGGDNPDIYHYYNLWMPDFVGSNLLAPPPEAIVTDVTTNYGPGAVGGATYNDQLWGYPTEQNSYQLIANKAMMTEAGVTAPPTTWDELKSAAEAMTKKDGDKVTQAGMMFLKSWDTGVVHPWTSLLFSHGGEYVATDNSKVLFNEQPGLDTLNMQLDLLNSGAAMAGVLEDADFESGQVAMTIMANWWGATLRAGMQGGIENVSVSPIPYTEGNASVSVQYQWIWGVSATTQKAEAAWSLLQWLNNPVNGGSSPMGDFLTSALNAIPGRSSDQAAHEDLLSDAFVAPFVEALKTSRSEPIIPGAAEIKTGLQKQIEAAWFGEKTAEESLTEAADEANKILAEKGS
jgi:multiple sugar transport system substrate-binding protein